MSSRAFRLLMASAISCSTILAVSAFGAPIRVSAKRRIHFQFSKSLRLEIDREVGEFPKQSQLDQAKYTIKATYQARPSIIDEGNRYKLITYSPQDWVVASRKVGDKPKLVKSGKTKKWSLTPRDRSSLTLFLMPSQPVAGEIQYIPKQQIEGEEPKARALVETLGTGDEEVTITIEEFPDDPSLDPEIIEIPVEPYPPDYDPCAQ